MTSRRHVWSSVIRLSSTDTPSKDDQSRSSDSESAEGENGVERSKQGCVNCQCCSWHAIDAHLFGM